MSAELWGACQVCSERMAVHSHHRKMRSQGGGDEPSNLLRVCLECHAWIHANPSDAYARGLLVHSWADPANVRLFVATPEQEEPAFRSLAVKGDTVYDMNTHEVVRKIGPQPGEECSYCHRRVPHPKKESSPKSKVFSTRIPLDDVETFNELVDAAAEHMGAKSKPHHVYNTLLVGLTLILQAPKEQLPGG